MIYVVPQRFTFLSQPKLLALLVFLNVCFFADLFCFVIFSEINLNPKKKLKILFVTYKLKNNVGRVFLRWLT